MNEQSDNTIKSITGTGIPGDRVHVVIDLAENHTKPNLEMTLTDSQGMEVSQSYIMGTLDAHIEFTLHVRAKNATPPFRLTCKTWLEEELPIDSRSVEIKDYK